MEQFFTGVTELAGHFLLFTLLLMAVVQALTSIPATLTWIRGDRRSTIRDTAVSGWVNWLVAGCLISIISVMGGQLN